MALLSIFALLISVIVLTGGTRLSWLDGVAAVADVLVVGWLRGLRFVGLARLAPLSGLIAA